MRIAQFNYAVALFLILIKKRKEHIGIGYFKIIMRVINLVLMVNIAIGNAIHPFDIINAIYLLDIHSQAFNTIGNLPSYRVAVNAAALLEIGKLGNFHPIQPDLPA